jgi:hypothetical protein
MLDVILATIYFSGCIFWFLSIFSNKVGRGDDIDGVSGYMGRGGILATFIFIAWATLIPAFVVPIFGNFFDHYLLGLIIGLPLGLGLFILYARYTIRIYSRKYSRG